MPVAALSDAEIEEGLRSLNGWQREGDAIVRTFSLPSYMAGLAFASAVGTVCEALDHHPDLTIGWKKVRVSFSTHDAGHKISARDLEAAAAVERLGYPRS
jgi:4a-hydroxytetrahydrobiopterin dehydratase